MRLALLLAALASGMALRMPQGMPQRMPQLAPRAVVLMASQIEADIQQTTADNAVVVYSKSWCPYCAQTKALFDSMDQPYTAIELDNLEDGDKLQAALLEMTQQRTVPNVFIGGQHLGGVLVLELRNERLVDAHNVAAGR